MARYLIVLVAAAALAAGWHRLATHDTAVPEVPAPATPSLPAVESAPLPGNLGEIDVQLARRSVALDGCRRAGEKNANERLAEYEAQADEMLRVLRSSTDAEHLLVAGLVSWRKTPEQALEFLGRAAAADPRNPLAASQMLELCLETDACNRARPGMERNLIAADKANGLAWVTVARSRLGRGDEQGALAALRQAAAAPSIEDYYADYVLLFDRALAASSNLPPFERSIAAHGHGAAVFTAGLLIARDCEERGPNASEWLDVCLRLGERFEHSSGSIMTRAVGMGLQAKMYEYGGDSRAQDAAERRYQGFRDEWTTLASRTARALELKDATVQRRFLDTFKASGEVAAMQYLAAEIEARLPQPQGDQESRCPTP